MKGIKLTPFLLFVILLVVLILAMLFGATSSKPILENMENSGQTSSWKPVLSNSVQAYNSGAQLDDIIAIKDGQSGMFYDSSNGNVVITDNLVGNNYLVLTRDSMGVPVDTTNTENSTAETSNTVNLTTAPWTYVSNQLSLLYCPYKANTLIIVIDNSDNVIKQVFKSSKGISNSFLPINTSTGITNTVEPSEYSQLGQHVKEQITINGKNSDVTKIANNVYYSNTLGIAVGSPGNVFDVSDDFKSGIAKQGNDNILVISCLIDESSLLTVIVVKEPTSNIYKVASANFIKYSSDEGNANDSFSISLETPNGDGPGSEPDAASGSSSSSSSSDNKNDSSSSDSNGSCNNQYKAKPSYICPNNNNSSGSENGSDGVCNSSDYIRKSEIVPPVCPGCPPCPNVTPASCNLSINSNGEIVDCTGKKYEPEGGVLGASPATFGSIGGTISNVSQDAAGIVNNTISETGEVLGKSVGVLAPTVDNTVDTAGNVLEKGLDTAGGALDKTLDTAGGALETTVDGAGNIVGELGATVGDIASGIGSGIGGIGSGASNLVQGVSSDVAGLGNNMIDSTTGLLKSTGSGIMQLSEQQQQMMQQQMMQQQMMQQQMGQQPMMQQQMGQQPMMQQGYMQPGYMQGDAMQPNMGYSYPQSCPRGGSNFMPITNDFSQFT